MRLRQAGFTKVRDRITLCSPCIRRSDGTTTFDPILQAWYKSAYEALRPIYLKFRGLKNYPSFLDKLPQHAYENTLEGKPELVQRKSFVPVLSRLGTINPRSCNGLPFLVTEQGSFLPTLTLRLVPTTTSFPIWNIHLRSCQPASHFRQRSGSSFHRGTGPSLERGSGQLCTI